jgi:hypothetical protein
MFSFSPKVFAYVKFFFAKFAIDTLEHEEVNMIDAAPQNYILLFLQHQ